MRDFVRRFLPTSHPIGFARAVGGAKMLGWNATAREFAYGKTIAIEHRAADLGGSRPAAT